MGYIGSRSEGLALGGTVDRSLNINMRQSIIFDLEREFGYSVRDTPHRLNISATLEFPLELDGAGCHTVASSVMCSEAGL